MGRAGRRQRPQQGTQQGPGSGRPASRVVPAARPDDAAATTAAPHHLAESGRGGPTSAYGRRMDDLGWSSPARRAEADAFNGLAPPAGVLQDVQDLLAAGWIFEGIDRKDGWVRVPIPAGLLVTVPLPEVATVI